MKRRFLALFLILFVNSTIAQSITEIDKVLEVPDSLTYKKEIRIHEFAAITNHRSLFRLYFGNDDKWHAELYKSYKQANHDAKNQVEKTQLTLKNDGEFIWLKILTTDIQYLADWKSIQYKLKSRGEITYEKGKYDLLEPRMKIMDGVNVFVKFRNNEKSNSVVYGNPRTYFGYYPNVDELVSFVILLDLINTEFGTSY